MLRCGLLRAEKVEYKDGIGCCIWRTWEDEDEDMGVCWDFELDELEDIMSLLTELRDAPAEKYDED